MSEQGLAKGGGCEEGEGEGDSRGDSTLRSSSAVAQEARVEEEEDKGGKDSLTSRQYGTCHHPIHGGHRPLIERLSSPHTEGGLITTP